MPDVLKDLQRASFFGIAFACPRYSIKGGIRDHVHEYRHTPGGQPEKLGRRLYTIEMDALFSTETLDYQGAWPGDLYSLRRQFEQETTADLVIPTLGTIQAYCVDWTIDTNFRSMRDGEHAHFTFREDALAVLAADTIIQTNFSAMPKLSDALILEAEAVDIDVDVFQAIVNFANDIQALGQQIELQAEIMADKVDSIIVAVQRIDATLDVLNDPPHHKVVAALHNLGAAAVRLKKDILRKSVPIVSFTTPSLMSITDVSVSIYGSTERAIEIMQLNALDDPFSILPGTALRVYAPLV